MKNLMEIPSTKGSLLAITSLLLVGATALAKVDLGDASSSTPYDRYMIPVKKVLSSLPGETASMEKAQSLMRVGRSFRYSFTDPHNPALPATTASLKAGDCKAKSLWLCDQLGDNGVRFVIGKARRTSRLSHAWVMWQHEGRWWILDCTNTSRPIPADRVSINEYIPLYSYDKANAYRHATTAQPTAAIGGKKNPVAQSVGR